MMYSNSIIYIELCLLMVVVCVINTPVGDAQTASNLIGAKNNTIILSSNSNKVKNHLKDTVFHNEIVPEAKLSEYTIEYLSSSDLRITLGTAIADGMHIKVRDISGVPIKGAKIRTNTIDGIRIAPGWLDGTLLTKMETDSNGEFVGMIISEYSAEEKIVHSDNTISEYIVSVDSGAPPTIDEFGERMPGKIPYQITLYVGDAAIKYNIEIDMGPVLIASDKGSDAFNLAQWVGRMSESPVEMIVLYYQKIRECDNQSENNTKAYLSSNHAGKTASLGNIIKTMLYNLPHSVEATRLDNNINSIMIIGNREKDKLFNVISENNGFVDSNQLTGNNYINKKSDEPMQYFIVMDRVKGTQMVTIRAPDIDIIYDNSLCQNNRKIQKKYFNGQTTIVKHSFMNSIPVRSASPKIDSLIEENMPPEPVPDPLPLTKSYSGLNLSQLVIMINNKEVFGKTIDALHLNKYPNYIEAYIDGKEIDKLDRKTLKDLSPGTFRLIYYPTLDELRTTGQNTFIITGIEDRTGNKGNDSIANFTLPGWAQ